MAITALPTAPSRADPTNFSDRADAFLTALPTFGTEANVLQADVNSKQIIASTAATNAAASALAAGSTAGCTIWVSGTTYAIGDNRFSPINFLTYRRKLAGAGTTDPSLDSTNWALISGIGDVDTTSTQTITGIKTLSNASNVINGTFNGSIGATTPAIGKFLQAYTASSAITSSTAFTLNCALSNVFTIAMTGSVLAAGWTISNPQDGQTINIFITQNASVAYTLGWPTSFKWSGGVGGTGTISTTLSAVDLLVMTYRSSTGFWYVSLSKGFA